ncbi:MAG: sigma-70 family RNA polymerase sigma factor [Kiritimatiellae bacterium]|nr:sigma-70 family RNA polymerase sigma factor [Kiritimatiellia bacterium]
MSIFPQTSYTILRRLSDGKIDDQRLWERFFELYNPAVRGFIRLLDPEIPPEDIDDLAQEVSLRLVELIRSNSFDSSRGRFRSVLITIVRHLLIDRMRTRTAHRTEKMVSIEELEVPALSPSAAQLVDLKWRIARHRAAIEHILTKTALSKQSCEVYRLSEEEGLAMTEIAARLSLAPNAVRRIASRVRKMVAAVEAEYE